MLHVKGFLFVLLFTLLLGACTQVPKGQVEEGYQFGDLSKTLAAEALELLIMRQHYCTLTDPIARKTTLDVIRQRFPTYPVDGICTDLLTTTNDSGGNQR